LLEPAARQRRCEKCGVESPNLLDAVFKPCRRYQALVWGRLPEPDRRRAGSHSSNCSCCLLFVGLRWLIGRVVGRTIRALVEREQGLGNEGRAARIRTLASLTKSIVFYTLAFVFVIAALDALGFNVVGVLGTAAWPVSPSVSGRRSWSRT
jgi:hypothetical protein